MAAYWRNEISLRKLRAMVLHLPPKGPRARALGYPWDDTDYLLADVIDAVQSSGYGIRRVMTDKPGREPKRYPRPKAEDLNEKRIGTTEGSGLTQEEVIARLNVFVNPTESQRKALKSVPVQ